MIGNVERTLRADGAVRSVVAPGTGVSISRDGHTAIVQAGAARTLQRNGQGRGRSRRNSLRLSTAGVLVQLTGASGMWSDFNAANRTAMMKSEVISWPVTLGILLLAFGSLVAAGLPLMLTMIGLMSAAGLLYLGTLISPISIWAMNFALMFALALGIDYALFVVHRFRGALFGQQLTPVEATAVAMDTAGKAVLFSGVTVLISLCAVMFVPQSGVPVDEPRDHVLGHLRAGRDADPAPGGAGQARSAGRQARTALGALRRAPLRAVCEVGRAAVAPAGALGGGRAPHPRWAGDPGNAAEDGDAVDQGCPDHRTPRGSATTQVQRAFGPGATGPLQIVTPASQASCGRADRAASIRGIAALMPTQTRNGYALVTAIPRQDPSNPAVGRTIDRLRSELPAGSLIGGAVAENHDLQAALSAKTPLVIGVILGLGFVLLLIALQAPLLAAVGVLTNLLATGAAFGVAKWVFQDGTAHSLLGFQSQGFLDAWGPVFFFAMIFAISMDYTVFLLSAAKEHWDHTHDPHEAMVGCRRAFRTSDLRRRRR